MSPSRKRIFTFFSKKKIHIFNTEDSGWVASCGLSQQKRQEANSRRREK